MLRSVFIVLVAVAAIVPAQPHAKPEAMSASGKPLYAAPPSPDALAQLDAARAALAQAPGDADAIIWVGRRTGYLQRFREAIEIFSGGISRHPADARMYRHRGHRYISVREFDKAIADLARAADLVRGRPDEVEPDGLPNARGIPTSTLNSNIYYHLGLAHYLKGNFDAALGAYRDCATFSRNPDMTVATSHWLYMTLRRLGRTADAQNVLEPVAAGMDIIENRSYHQLLLMYKGELDAGALMASATDSGLDAVTIGYGVGNWHLYNGRRDRALQTFREVVDRNPAQWPAFGYIAAETELARAR